MLLLIIRIPLCNSSMIFTTTVDGRGIRLLVVEGDAKVYEMLQALKFEYGEELEWLIAGIGTCLRTTSLYL